MTDTQYALCRFCHAFCSLKVQLEEGRVTHIIGDKDNPVYHGYSCIKGRNYHRFLDSPNRVLQPLKRAADGSFEKVTMSSALDEVAGRLQRIIAEHGPRSVAMYSGTFSHFCVGGVMTRAAFMEAIGSSMVFTNATIDQPGKPIAMALHGRWGGGPQAFSESDVCMLVGANPLVSMWGGIPAFNPARRLHKAKQRGLKLIVIDPRRTETARKADIHLQCLPGHDPAILASMIQIMLSEGLYDKAFVKAETEGFDLLKTTVAQFDPKRVAREAGIELDDLVAAARMFGNARKGNATGGTGSNMAPHGTLMEYLLLCLNSVCGRWVKAHETVPNLGVLFRMYSGVARAEKPMPAWGFGEPLRVRGLANTAAGLQTAALPDEILQSGEGQVRALFVVGGNPLVAFPNRDKVARALQSLDLLVVVDPNLSATAQMADYVIGPRLGFETPAISFANEGMSVYGLSIGFQEPFAQYQPALVEPPEGSDVAEDWRIFYELGRRMGHQLAYRGWAYDMTSAPTTDELIEVFVKKSPVPLAEIKRYPGGHIFEHRSAPAQPRERDWPHRLNLAHEDMMRDLQTLARKPDAPQKPSTSSLELLLSTRRHHHVYNSVGHTLEPLARKKPYNPAYLNPVDAQRIGVKDGSRIAISTPTATVAGTVELDDTVRPGVLSVAHGFPNGIVVPGEESKDTSASSLIDDMESCDAYSGMPQMSAIAVKVSLQT